MATPFAFLLNLAEAGRLPDSVVRKGIRNLLAKRLAALRSKSCETLQNEFRKFVSECSNSSVAVLPEKANEQHYEVPAEFFHLYLGPRLKYSCCEWRGGTRDLAEAEEIALATTCTRAQLQDGHRILELGCGWGSLSLWMAEQFPQSQITAVSNSNSQRQFIMDRAASKGLSNLEVITADMNDFSTDKQFDRVVSVEMFEHMRNHAELLRRVSTWLVDGGKLFVHIFCHKDVPYLYEDNGPQDWMTRYFFSGGMMPSDHLLARYQRDLNLEDQWRWNGQHYEKTCNAWLEQLDAQRDEAMVLLKQAYGESDALLWLQRWRMFLMACAELFAYNEGNEWWVSHYLFAKPE